MLVALIGSGPLRGEPGRFREVLVDAGFTCVDPPGQKPLTAGELLTYLPAADAVIAGGEPIPGALIAACPRLRVISRTGVGYEAVDLDAATAHRVVVAFTPGTNHEAVAEQAFALILALCKRLIPLDADIRRGGWDRTPPMPVRGKTLGLLGLGRIGRAMATRAIAFGMKVITYEHIPDVEFDARHGIMNVPLDRILAESDVLSLHLPATETTRGVICEATIRRMKPGALLINTGRGALVVEDDLYAALVEGHLGGAGLDVFQREPPMANNPLFSLPNVVLSPHNAGIDTQAMEAMASMAAENIVALYKGLWPAAAIVNPEVAPGWTW